MNFDFETESLSEELLRRGVIVRPMRWMGFPNAIRVSVGTHEENETFLRVLGEVYPLASRLIETYSKGKSK